jgi:hypothetical protein
VSQTCKPSYWVVIDLEGRDSRPAQAESSRDPISINSWEQGCIPVIPNYLEKHKEEEHGPVQRGHKS